MNKYFFKLNPYIFIFDNIAMNNNIEHVQIQRPLNTHQRLSQSKFHRISGCYCIHTDIKL